MNSQTRRRRRGVILTPQGFLKLQAAKSHAESCENNGICYTQEALSDRTGLDPDTLMKIFAGEVGVDKRTLFRCFRAFNLVLEPSDYKLPQADEAISSQQPIQNPKPVRRTQFDSEAGERTRSTDGNIENRIDWGEAPDVSVFYGRSEELTKLRHWILGEHCRLVTLLGIAGMGKTCLSVKLAEQIQDKFEFIIWRSLLPAPPIKEFIAELIRFLSNEQEVDLPGTIYGYLRASRCLLVFDNVETILQGGDLQETECNNSAGRYCNGYESYGELLKCIGEVPHQSCLVLTSREKPKEIGLLEGETLPVRVLQVKGLQVVDIQEIFRGKGSFWGSTADWQRLIECYAGNPLALKVVSPTIQNFFDGNIAEFLNQNTVIFGDIFNLVEQQFNRLSDTEKEIINWLVLNRHPVSFSALRSQMSSSVSPQKLLEALESLEARSLIDKEAALLSLQPVVMKYATYRLIEDKITELQQKVFSGEEYHLPILLG
jgi:transcriptional regulator with XRE-family HTH domain/DNA-binding HxlR family transcriptional regulator